MSLARLLVCFGLLSGLFAPAQEHRPGILYSTYLGGSGNERGDAIAIDREGNVYVAGVTSSTDFPTTEGAFLRSVDPNLKCNDFLSVCPNAIFVTKLSPDGQKIIWSTYFHQGFSMDLHGMRVDDLQVNSTGEVYIAGTASASRFPLTPNAFETTCPTFSPRSAPVCAFVAKLSRDGSSVLFASFLGTANLGMTIRKLRLDAAQNVIVAGDTFFQTGYVAKLNPQFTQLLFVHLLGGAKGAGVTALEVDASGIYVAGGTHSADFPVTPGALKSQLTGETDGFVKKLSHHGEEIYSTLIGGGGIDAVSALTIESDGSLLIGGSTGSSDFPVSSQAFQPTFAGGGDDAFVASLSGDGSQLRFSTFLGGSGDPIWTIGEGVRGIVRTPSGSLLVVGVTRAPDFPVKNSQLLKPREGCPWPFGCAGVFVAALDGTASQLLGSTVVGSPNEDSLRGFASRSSGWWVTGETFDAFPVTADALQSTDMDAGRAFVTELFVGPQDFSLEIEASMLDLSSSNTTIVKLAGAPALADQVRLSCVVPLASYRCHFSSDVVFIGAGKKQVSLTVEREAGSALAFLISPMVLSLGLFRHKTRIGSALFVASLAMALLFLGGCRGVLPSSSEYTKITVMAQSSTVSHSASLQVSASSR